MALRTIADPAVCDNLVRRLRRLTPDARRRWGTLTPHEVLCHLGDATAMVLLDRPRAIPVAGHQRLLRSTIGLWTPLRWPHGLPTSPHYNPHTLGTRPTDFERDRDRAIDGLARLGTADASQPLEPAHGFFGVMSTHAWQRWAFKHTDHHLRQFGL